MIPLVDLAPQQREIAEEVESGWAEVVAGSSFVLGPAVEAFEQELAAYSQVEHCVGVGSGTDAIELALRACGVGRGTEVVVPANTFIATALAVLRAGATPVLVDIDPGSHLLDVDQVEARVRAGARAVVPVHLYGQLAPMDDLLAVTAAAGAVVVEDAAQCHGARRHGQRAGRFGAIAATSFYPGKNLGAYGDGGALLTDDDALATRLRALRNWGSEVKYQHPVVGFNSRLDSLQAVVLSAKLRRLDAWNDQRRQAAARYDELLADVSGVLLPQTLSGNEHVWHLYVVRVDERDAVLQGLHRRGIGAGVHYPVPVHLHGAFEGLGYGPGTFPAAEAAAASVLSLPIYPGIEPVQQEQVAAALREAVAG